MSRVITTIKAILLLPIFLLTLVVINLGLTIGWFFNLNDGYERYILSVADAIIDRKRKEGRV